MPAQDTGPGGSEGGDGAWGGRRGLAGPCHTGRMGSRGTGMRLRLGAWGATQGPYAQKVGISVWPGRSRGASANTQVTQEDTALRQFRGKVWDTGCSESQGDSLKGAFRFLSVMLAGVTSLPQALPPTLPAPARFVGART